MNWHEQIQRFLDGQASAEEADALLHALDEDTELRALYLDYVNLDVALEAAAEKATIAGDRLRESATSPPPIAAMSPRSWRWLAAAAACAVLIVYLVLARQREPAPARPDLAATIASTQNAIARLSITPPASPAWSASPTASLLDPPRTPQ